MGAEEIPTFAAPPIDVVATGVLAGICVIDISEPVPSSEACATGDPTTDRLVNDAVKSGKFAVPPALSKMT